VLVWKENLGFVGFVKFAERAVRNELSHVYLVGDDSTWPMPAQHQFDP
jgi:hypothetical protein